MIFAINPRFGILEVLAPGNGSDLLNGIIVFLLHEWATAQVGSLERALLQARLVVRITRFARDVFIERNEQFIDSGDPRETARERSEAWVNICMD